jgi:hypothetical protein
VVWLKLVIADGPMLDGRLRIDEALVIAMLEMRLVDEIDWLKAIGLAVPMHRRTAQAGSRQKSLPSGQR